jgi:predicted nucleic acid-binding protein
LASSFLDTSALTKLYHEEPGSEYVELIVNQPGSKAIVSRLSLVEMEAVFAIKVRTSALNENGRSLALRRLRADIARYRLIVGPPIEPKHYRSAAKLLRLHGVSRGLRTLDALELAIALDMLEASWISVILSADKRLAKWRRLADARRSTPLNPAWSSQVRMASAFSYFSSLQPLLRNDLNRSHSAGKPQIDRSTRYLRNPDTTTVVWHRRRNRDKRQRKAPRRSPGDSALKHSARPSAQSEPLHFSLEPAPGSGIPAGDL